MYNISIIIVLFSIWTFYFLYLKISDLVCCWMLYDFILILLISYFTLVAGSSEF
jgi:hypothetical protein